MRAAPAEAHARRPKRCTNARAVSATSRQPLSIVSACPRLGISTISATPSLRSCFLYEALAIAGGTVCSFSPEMIRRGPRSGVLRVHLRLCPRVEIRGRRLEERRTRRRHGVGLVQLLGLVLADGVRGGVAELVVRERDSAVAIGRVAEDGRCRLQRRDGQRQPRPEGRGVDCHRGGREPRPASIFPRVQAPRSASRGARAADALTPVKRRSQPQKGEAVNSSRGGTAALRTGRVRARRTKPGKAPMRRGHPGQVSTETGLRRPRFSLRESVPDDLDEPAAVARAVELDEENALPGAEA
jgi:hypothetical protein